MNKDYEVKKEKWLKDNGFNENLETYVYFLDNSYEIKETLKDDGFRFNKVLYWHTPELKEEYSDKTIKVALDEIAEIHIGLNDLSISLKKPFLFELLTDGTVDALAGKIKRAGKRFGVGGVGAVGNRIALPAENIFAEHYRLGSEMVILSRAFCKREEFDTFEKFKSEFNRRYTANRAFEARLAGEPLEYFEQKHRETKEIIGKIKR